tara:strand:- start:2288 stop:2599 length:312 start_codon:yes stop_codon:yes gene_type:complete
MIRWLARATASAAFKNKALTASNKASKKSRDAKQQFDRARRERDEKRRREYMYQGLSDLSEAVSYTSNAIEPLAEMSLVASLLAESVGKALDEQTKDIVKQLK